MNSTHRHKTGCSQSIKRQYVHTHSDCKSKLAGLQQSYLDLAKKSGTMLLTSLNMLELVLHWVFQSLVWEWRHCRALPLKALIKLQGQTDLNPTKNQENSEPPQMRSWRQLSTQLPTPTVTLAGHLLLEYPLNWLSSIKTSWTFIPNFLFLISKMLHSLCSLVYYWSSIHYVAFYF